MKRYRIQIEIIECKFEVQNKNYRKQVKKTGKKITNGKKIKYCNARHAI